MNACLRFALLVLIACSPTALSATVNCSGGFAGPYPCENVDLLGRLDLEELGAAPGVEVNDLWGWTDPETGKEYVMIGLWDGTAFVDVSDPESPVWLGTLPSHVGSDHARDIKVYEDHAFIVAEILGHGMQVFDLTELRSVSSPPATFAETAFYDAEGHDHELPVLAHNLAVNEETGYAYIIETNPANYWRYLHYVDISDPVNPVFAGWHVLSRKFHDAQCVVYRGPDMDYVGREICFVAGQTDLTIVDVTDKAASETLAWIWYRPPVQGWAGHQGWLTEDHTWFFMGDEADERYSRLPTRTFVWNLEDLTDPFIEIVHTHATGATDHNMFVKGNHLYQANYQAGLRILDIGCGGAPDLQEVGFFDTWPQGDTHHFHGAWGVYPYFESGVIAVSTQEDGLFLLRADDLPCADQVPPTVTEATDDRSCLWPPSHDYVCFDKDDFAPEIQDDCADGVTWRFAGCPSDQPDDALGMGDGATTEDCLLAADGESFCVRAERASGGPGTADGRRYEVRITARDACGNESAPTAIARIHVPHDQGGAAGCSGAD